MPRPSIHSNVVRNLPLPKCDLTSHGTLGLGKSCTIVVNKEITLDVSQSHESCGATVEVKGKVVTATARAPVPLLPVGICKGKDKARGSQRSKANNVLQRSRRLTKDEMILWLGNGKAVAMEAVGLVDYVNLMRSKSEVFGRFNEYRLEIENQTGRKIKALRSDRGGEYLSAKFIGCLEEAKIISRWTSPRTPHLNGVSEKRNLTLLDIVRSMMSFTELPLSFWVYALEMAAKLLNMAPSKKISQMPYVIWHGKPVSYKYLKVWGRPAYVKRLVKDKLSLRSSLCRFIRYPKETMAYYFYDPSEQKVFIPQNTLLMEKGFPSGSRPQ
ncbi:UNVERIFIED_CONTAM: Retrovirus-related Pol polyprotein from transposon TNT 1-94 [Sesamum calycinum]|uniref:Retrovirus-related Pol polyprotein from transposon TNT 1-94 n=1 Tax=Sesamum calycinum TaxID=2727403 RepID=A0AAW2IYE5_9LAMI